MSCFMQVSTKPPHVPRNSYSIPNHHGLDPQHRKQTITLLQNCENMRQITQIQGSIIKNGQENDPFVAFELIRLCSRYHAVDYALKTFRLIREPNVYLYTALIDGLVLSGLCYRAITIYVEMIQKLSVPDEYVINSMLKACVLELVLKMGREVHAQALKNGLCENRMVKLNLIELYGKCGEFEDMKRVFDEMQERDMVAMTVMMSCYFEHGLIKQACDVFSSVIERDVVLWTAMIDGLVRNGEVTKALEYFRKMQRCGVKANEFTIVCVLSACSQLGSLELGEWVHSYVEKYDIKVNHFVGSALVNMYSRCGSIEEAQKVFEQVKEKDISTYNSMIAGLALNGKSIDAIELFQRMVKEGLKPTNITFVGVLNACSHGGLVDIGFEIFFSMQKVYHIEPQIEHYGCMVDLLGRVGRVKEAYEFIQEMKVNPDHIIWGSFLNACKVHKSYELGEPAAKILLNHKSSDTGAYILVSNFYSSCEKWEEALKVRSKLKERGILKEPGCSYIEVDNKIHEFMLGDIRHPLKKEIYEKLREIGDKLQLEGYDPQVEMISQDIMDAEKERALMIHSERLALCYGLISTEPRCTLRIMKNLRVCDDCHTMMKLVSKVTERRIIMRDRNRFHHFDNGSCSCGDHW